MFCFGFVYYLYFPCSIQNSNLTTCFMTIVNHQRCSTDFVVTIFCFDYERSADHVHAAVSAGNSNLKKLSDGSPHTCCGGFDVMFSKSSGNTFFGVGTYLGFRPSCSTWCLGQPVGSLIFLSGIGHTSCSRWSMYEPLP